MTDSPCEKALLDALVEVGVSDGRLLIAVSGGRDSMVLLSLLERVAPTLGLALVVGHVNHRLRGDESDADERFVAEVAHRGGIDFLVRRVDPAAERSGGSSRKRPSLEEAARDLRRAALLEIAAEAGARWIATAHHAGDQAETVLLRLLRGTGPEGLAAMRPVSRDRRWLRPLLDIDPDDLAAHAAAQGLGWREDASNQDRQFARNRIRLDEMPRLAERFNPQLRRALCGLAEAQRRDSEWMESLVETAASTFMESRDGLVRLELDGWAELPEALARRLVRRALLETGLDRDVTRGHIARVLAFVRRGRAVGRDKILELPCGTILRRGDECFRLARELAAKRARPTR